MEPSGRRVAGPAQDTGRVTYEYGLTNKELFFAGLSNTTSVGLIFAGLVVGVLQIVGFIFDVMGGAADGAVESALVFAGSQASAYLIGAVSAGVIVLVLVLWVLSAVGSCIGYGGFKARRRNNRIEVEYGLLQHTFQGIDIDRVQSVVVKQSFIRRLLGYCELSLGKIDAGTDEDSSNQKNTLANQGIIIHPFVKMNRVPEILAGSCRSSPTFPMRRSLSRRWRCAEPCCARASGSAAASGWPCLPWLVWPGLRLLVGGIERVRFFWKRATSV